MWANPAQQPYRWGAAWGYLRDPSELVQMGARWYWPEIGRFIQQDPIGDGAPAIASSDRRRWRVMESQAKERVSLTRHTPCLLAV